MDLGSRIAAGDAPDEGYWLRAEQQTGGKGRLGRTWISPPGNLYCSTPVLVRAGDPAPHTLSFVTALALHDTMSKFLSAQHDLMLKWPNDVQVGQAKIAGILLERVDQYIVVGIGANIEYAPNLAGRQTTHLAAYGVYCDCGTFLEKLAQTFATRLQEWRNSGAASVLRDWEVHAHGPGELLTVTGSNGDKLTGTYAGLADDGSLQLRLADGTLTAIYAGDVSRP